MARRKFRDIAVISGMVVQNYPGIQKNNKSLQASSGLIFNVLEDYVYITIRTAVVYGLSVLILFLLYHFYLPVDNSRGLAFPRQGLGNMETEN